MSNSSESLFPTVIKGAKNNKALQSEEDAVNEIEYVISSIEKSLERWEGARGKSPIKDTLLPISILVSSGYLGSFLPHTNSTVLSNEIYTIVYFAAVAILEFYCIVSIIFRYKDNTMKSRIMKSQADGAIETLQISKSWIDRSEMSFQLKALMETRAKYLEALVLQVRYISRTKS